MAEIKLHREGLIATLIVSNPDRHNAMTLSMWQQLASQLSTLNADSGIRVIVLTGEGDKSFVAGADISEFEAIRSNPDAVKKYDETVATAQSLLANSEKITVARVKGLCFGGGLGLLLACDLRYCSDSSRFRMPAGRLGLGYQRDGVQQMVQTIGASRTADLFYTARIFNGVEAERIGVVHQMFYDNEFTSGVNELVQQVADNAPLTLRAAKLAIKDLLAKPEDQDEERVYQAVTQCFQSLDYMEGRRAFMEKRPPKFTGE